MGTNLTRPRTAALVLLAVLLLPASVIRSETFGGIEIGGKGVKATVIDVEPSPTGPEVKVLLTDSRNTAITAGLAKTGRFDPDALKASADAVAHFAQRLQKEHKLPPERIHVVGSSGLFSAIEGRKDDINTNQQALTDAVRKASGQPMSFIDVQREAELSIAGIIPPSRRETSVLLDIGGGNTKGGSMSGRERYITFGVPFGSVTFVDAARKQEAATLGEQLALAREKVLEPALRKSIEGKPELVKRDMVFLSGGACWALATLVKPGDRTSYVRLSAEDIKTFHAMVNKQPGTFPTPDLSSIEDPKKRAAAEKELEKVKAALKPEHLQAGAEILLGLANELKLEKAQRIFFVRHSQVGWLLAYIKEKAEPKGP